MSHDCVFECQSCYAYRNYCTKIAYIAMYVCMYVHTYKSYYKNVVVDN